MSEFWLVVKIFGNTWLYILQLKADAKAKQLKWEMDDAALTAAFNRSLMETLSRAKKESDQAKSIEDVLEAEILSDKAPKP